VDAFVDSKTKVLSRANLVNEFAIKMVSVINAKELAWFVAREIVGSLGYEDCVIYYLNEKANRLIQIAAIGIKNPTDEEILNPLTIEIGVGVTGHVALTKQSTLVSDMSVHDNYVTDVEPALSELCVPIMFGDRLYGVLDSECKTANGYGEEDRKIFETVARLIAAKLALIEQTELVKKYTAELEAKVEERTLELQKANDKLEYLASTDPLTELVNRRRLDEVLEQEFERTSRYQGELSLILLDIDNFKAVNDTQGHQIGDEVIAGVGKIAKVMSRISDTPGRWGGEEFLIVVPQTNRDSAVAFAEKLRLSIENTEFSGGVRVSASFGVASFQPGETIPVVLQRADEALYRAKKLGRNRIETDVAS
jgi:diguanylate cyclase (GGDEF)-like protein